MQQDIILFDHLSEIKAIAREVGAKEAWTIRGAKETLRIETDIKERSMTINVNGQGTILIIRFPYTDGEEDGIEADIPTQPSTP